METGILQHLERPHTLRSKEQHIGYLHLLGMENNDAGVFMHVQLDTNNASEVEGSQVGVDGQIIVEGGDGFRKSHAVPGEWLAVGGYGDILGLTMAWQLCS